MKYLALLSIFACSVLPIYGQNCGFVGTNDTSFDMGEASQSTEPGTVLWQKDIFNVVHSSALNTSHFYYITGLRYTTYYQYVAADIFQQFPDVIRAQYLERNVTFTCADGGYQNYYFRLRIHDNNTHAPEFNNVEYTIDTTVPWPIENPINGNTPIIISDRDYEEQNANILLTVSHPAFRAVATRIDPEPYPSVYYYMINVYLATANVAPASYPLMLFAYDGFHSVSVPVTINVRQQ